MSRIFTDGGEQGDMSFWDINYGYTIGTTPRSGNYSYFIRYSCENVRSLPSLSELYYRFGLRIRTTLLSDNRSIMALTAANWQNQHMVSMVFSNGRVKVRLGGDRNGSGATVFSTDGVEVLKDRYYLFELHLKIDDTNGIIQLKRDGNLIFDYTGNTVVHGATVTTRLYHSGSDNDYDDIAMNDTTGTEDNSWCGDGRVIPLRPNGAGDSTQLSVYGATNNYEAVDEGMAGNGDTDYVYGNTVGLKDLYNVDNLNIPTYSEIKRVWVTASARTTSASGDKISVGIKSGTTEDWSDDITLGLNYFRYDGKIYEKNPATNSAWTIDDINSLQIGVKITEVGS